MSALLSESLFFGTLISLAAYGIGAYIKKKTGFALANPLLISIILVIAFLVITKVPYESYQSGAKYLSYLLTPATVALAIPLYRQFELLKKNWLAIVIGIGSGVCASVLSVTLFTALFHFNQAEWITFLPKSITTAIGMGISEEIGGIVPITVAAIVLTGVFGNIIAESVCRIFHITDPIAKGIGIGSASHAIGTSKAMEMGEIEGAMSSLSIVVSGIMTVLAVTVIAKIIGL